MNERKIEKRLKSYVQSMVMSQSKDELIKKAMKYLEFVYKQRTIDLELYILFGKTKNKMSKYKHYTILAEIACEKGTSFSEVKKQFVKTNTFKKYQRTLELYLMEKGKRNEKGVLYSSVCD